MSRDSRFSILEYRRLLAPALAALFLAGSSWAATPAAQSKIENRGAPFLWKIEGAGKKTSWLFGTIHMPRPDVATIAPVVRDAIDQADAVYTEIPVDMPTMLNMMPAMMLPNGKTIESVLGPKLTADLESEVKSISPTLTLAPLARFKPWAVVATLTQLEDQVKYPGTLALDMVIFQRAAMAGKKVGGIETPAEQVAVFEGFTDAEQILMVEDTIKQMREIRAEHGSVSDMFAKLYLAGDLDKLVEELMKLDASADHPDLEAKFMDRLLYKRNVVMAERMTKLLRDNPDTAWFFAVGAAHLQGDRGLLAALTKAGFKLTRVQ
ncbi:MAG: TraB/GumN family protein [Chthoniobacterales bacterium]